MQLFVRGVVTGFALSLGAAIFKKIARQIGLAEDDKKDKPDLNTRDGAVDPSLQHQFS